MRSPSARELKGRTIVGLNLNAYRVKDGNNGTKTMTDPTIILDDGTRLYFTVQEHPDGGEYGIAIGRTTKARR